MLSLPVRTAPASIRTLLAGIATSGKPDVSIDGYPEYATDISKLDAPQRALLKNAAARIVRSHATLSPIVAYVVVGHADRALRKAANEREAFELDVSEQRARSACKLLLEEVQRQAWQAHYSKVLMTVEVGVGYSNPIVPGAATEAQMRRNRRVEIQFAARHLSAPRCGV